VKSTREGFGEKLAELGESEKDLVVLDADVASSTRTELFADSFPDRFFNMGVAEQNMVLAAAGLALSGKPVVACSLAAFLTGRAFDQIRSCVAIPGIPVTLVGTHAGITVGEDGVTHQMTEDVALMRSLPGMSVMTAADAVSAGKILESAVASGRPVYVRLGREPVPEIPDTARESFTVGGGRLLVEGDGITICATGIMVSEAMLAAEVLARQGVSAEVIDCYSIKPLPEQVLLASFRRTGCCVVAEEHNRIGGLCEAVAGLVSARFPIPMRFVAIDDRYGQSGSPRELQEYYGLTSGEIVGAAIQAWALRRR